MVKFSSRCAPYSSLVIWINTGRVFCAAVRSIPPPQQFLAHRWSELVHLGRGFYRPPLGLRVNQKGIGFSSGIPVSGVPGEKPILFFAGVVEPSSGSSQGGGLAT